MDCNNHLSECMRALLEKREAQSARRRLTILPPHSVDFSSNDFLSLAHSALLRAAFIAELSRAVSIPLGSRGSRLLDGNSTYAEDIEQNIAAFHNAPAGLLFNSGYDANTALFSCIPQPGDVIIYDEYIHASVHEGMRLSRAGLCVSFRHNSVQDFEKILVDVIAEDSLIRAGTRNVFVALETVYSMDGDLAPIGALLEVMERALPRGNGHFIVDEAHSTGVYGLSGRGFLCELGLEHRVLARLHTFGKALSCGGAIVLCSSITRDYLINYARSLIYTTALGLPTLAMIKSVYALMRNGGTLKAQEQLWHLIHYFDTRLRSLPSTPNLLIPQEAPKSPIFSLCTPQPRSLAKHCQEAGFVVRAIVPPTVPQGGQRVRICLHAGNTIEDVDSLVRCIAGWVRRVEESVKPQPGPRSHL